MHILAERNNILLFRIIELRLDLRCSWLWAKFQPISVFVSMGSYKHGILWNKRVTQFSIWHIALKSNLCQSIMCMNDDRPRFLFPEVWAMFVWNCLKLCLDWRSLYFILFSFNKLCKTLTGVVKKQFILHFFISNSVSKD